MNYNIDKGRYNNGIGFIKDHLLEIYDRYDELISIMEKRKSKKFLFILMNVENLFLREKRVNWRVDIFLFQIKLR